MSWFESLALGLVQGLTEFLRVSSSTHLRLTAAFSGRSAAAVSDISRALDGTDLEGVLARLPTAPPAAAAACGFPGFSGDVRAYLAGHFTATRAFFREAARRGMCVVVRIDRGRDGRRR